MATEDLIPLESLVEKFEAFGLHTQRINGHDFNQLNSAFNQVDSERPQVASFVTRFEERDYLPLRRARIVGSDIFPKRKFRN
jgi:hypothetical protein